MHRLTLASALLILLSTFGASAQTADSGSGPGGGMGAASGPAPGSFSDTAGASKIAPRGPVSGAGRENAASAPMAVSSRQADMPVVVELFTSQGCISCPAADAVLAELGQRDDVIALALHVDYWDYIGWRDSFGEAAFTKRQKGYARAAGRRSIYTPQMVIGGTFDVVGSRPMKVMDAVQTASETPPLAHLSLMRDDDVLRIHAEPLGPIPEAMIHLVRYTPKATVEITAGENEGRTVTYTHIAHGWQVLGVWNGESALDMQVDVTGDDPVVVILQEKGYGPILAASRLR